MGSRDLVSSRKGGLDSASTFVRSHSFMKPPVMVKSETHARYQKDAEIICTAYIYGVQDASFLSEFFLV